MKRTCFVLFLVMLVASTGFSDTIDLEDFPKGKWLDPNWNAVWEFGANSIRLLDTRGSVIYDFDGKITDFSIDAGISEVRISFTCVEARRKYVFTKGVTDLDLVMTIDPDWTDSEYSVRMKMQN